jgi:hypothetical protein
MTYEVVSFTGDFPLAHQPNWDVQYVTRAEAIKEGRLQHELFNIEQHNEHYTMVLDLDKNEDEEVAWIIYQDKEYVGLKAQRLADDLAGECT